MEQWDDYETHIVIHPPKEFSFDEVLGYLQRSPNECLHRVENRRVLKLMAVAGAVCFVVIEESTSSNDITVHFPDGPTPTKEQRLEVVRAVWNWFDLDTDLRPFYTMAQTDTLLKELVTDYYGLRIVGVQDLFEAISWAIIGQQINLTFAYTLKRRFIEALGTGVEREGEMYWLFPTPAVVAGLEPERLTSLQFTGKKAEYLINVAGKIADGELTKEKLIAMGNFAAAEKALTAIRGIGPWTASYVAMRCLRNRAAFPVGDVGLQNAIKHQLGLDRKPTENELRKLAIPWRGFEAYATFYLWRSLQGLSA
ncbi:DNA-3-methyladenine glycosylase 2 [Alicyclobacillus dauci]|uniref:DNA-3-methyladenine glycosylase II n=1 Tax=Alicyclobacillus dauci TaxID=1475485 RepID=A0ABY6Z6V7_9BACL|nr:DNA-3-methyladenine glycosylase 2 [Alicyclobacillus dauci]WAH37760.1 DNA-3-methyladenine glycosylase 2 [Alicyclobacillus dauci]